MTAAEACSHGALDRSAFVTNLKTEVSVVTVKGNALVFHASACQLARKTGQAVQKGASCPDAEVGWTPILGSTILSSFRQVAIAVPRGVLTDHTHPENRHDASSILVLFHVVTLP